jgi:hypothetical protein
VDHACEAEIDRDRAAAIARCETEQAGLVSACQTQFADDQKSCRIKQVEQATKCEGQAVAIDTPDLCSKIKGILAFSRNDFARLKSAKTADTAFPNCSFYETEDVEQLGCPVATAAEFAKGYLQMLSWGKAVKNCLGERWRSELDKSLERDYTNEFWLWFFPDNFDLSMTYLGLNVVASRGTGSKVIFYFNEYKVRR